MIAVSVLRCLLLSSVAIAGNELIPKIYLGKYTSSAQMCDNPDGMGSLRIELESLSFYHGESAVGSLKLLFLDQYFVALEANMGREFRSELARIDLIKTSSSNRILVIGIGRFGIFTYVRCKQ